MSLPPKHAEAITRGDMLERRFLVGGKDDKSLADLSEKELVSKANTTLDIMESAALGSPEEERKSSNPAVQDKSFDSSVLAFDFHALPSC